MNDWMTDNADDDDDSNEIYSQLIFSNTRTRICHLITYCYIHFSIWRCDVFHAAAAIAALSDMHLILNCEKLFNPCSILVSFRCHNIFVFQSHSLDFSSAISFSLSPSLFLSAHCTLTESRRFGIVWREHGWENRYGSLIKICWITSCGVTCIVAKKIGCEKWKVKEWRLTWISVRLIMCVGVFASVMYRPKSNQCVTIRIVLAFGRFEQ